MIARILSRHACLYAALAMPGLAQNVLFGEGFATGMPPGWVNRFLGAQLDPWSPGTSPATNSPDMFHEWFCIHGFLFRNNLLISPRIDLTGFTRVDFACVQHQAFPSSRVSNTVEVSTDGGNTFTVLYNERGTWSGAGTIQASLDAYAGRSDVRIAFHYQGIVANEWRIDDVRITTPQPLLEIGGLAAGGTATFSVRGATPGALVAIGFSLMGAGPVPTPFGNIHLTQPIGILPLQFVGPGGTAAAPLAIPAWAAGLVVYAHAGELLPPTATLTNWLSRTVL